MVLFEGVSSGNTCRLVRGYDGLRSSRSQSSGTAVRNEGGHYCTALAPPLELEDWHSTSSYQRPECVPKQHAVPLGRKFFFYFDSCDLTFPLSSRTGRLSTPDAHLYSLNTAPSLLRIRAVVAQLSANEGSKSSLLGIPKEPVLESAELITSRLTGAGSLPPPVYGVAMGQRARNRNPRLHFPRYGSPHTANMRVRLKTSLNITEIKK
ncbi:hypothetical protein TNCV_3622101 [Trichonephila clavipes]|nr:hypothetical protein TNCV_3622101 [Trichonephila clavipes]